MKKYLVGGAVRDILLNNPVTDRDWVVVGAKPQELLNQGFTQIGKDFPVFLHPDSKEEYALARTERKSGQGYTGFTCDFNDQITLEQDLERRDLTINAIAMNEDNTLIDPFNGVEDLNKRILRHVSPAFEEDPLRVLRVARFAARFHSQGFTIAPETLTIMQSIVKKGEMQTLTPERVWKETEKALSTNDPQIFFTVLKQSNALAILYPELNDLFDVDSSTTLDFGTYTLLSLKYASLMSSEKETRFATLCHHFGKDMLSKSSETKSLGINQISYLCDRFKIPNQYKKIAYIVHQYYHDVQNIEMLTAEQLHNLFNSIDVWRNPHRLQQLIIVSHADKEAKEKKQIQNYAPQKYLEQAYKIAKSVSVKKIIDNGFTGKEIQTELTQLRIKALNEWKNAQFDYISNNQS